MDMKRRNIGMKSNNAIYDIWKRTCKGFKVFTLELKTKKTLPYSSDISDNIFFIEGSASITILSVTGISKSPYFDIFLSFYNFFIIMYVHNIFNLLPKNITIFLILCFFIDMKSRNIGMKSKTKKTLPYS